MAYVRPRKSGKSSPKWEVLFLPSLRPPFELMGETLDAASGRLQVIACPGHCVLHEGEVLLASDGFMNYLASPSPTWTVEGTRQRVH